MYSSGNVTVYVSNMDRAVKFYSETLGLKLAYRFGDHWASVEALEGPQISQQLRLITLPGASLVEVEAVGVLHQELAAAHHAEARADLVPELPLDVVEI